MNRQTENERIQQKNREATARAYKNIHAAFHDKADHDGINAVLRFLNEKKRVNPELSLSEQLTYIEEELYIKMRYVELERDWYTTSAVPMLVKTVDEHWFAVIPNTDGTCSYIDRGKKVKVTAKNAELFTDSAMYFYRGLPNKSITARDLVSFMIKCTSVKDRMIVLITSAAVVLTGMFLPWANSFIFSRVIPAGELSGTVPTAALVFSAVAVAAILKLLQSLILTNAMLRTSTYMQSGIFACLLALKPDFFKKTKSGALSKMIMEFSDISKIVSVKSISACIGMILSLLYLIQIYRYAPNLLGCVMLVTALLGAFMITEGTLYAKWLKKYSQSLSEMSGFCYELFSGIEQVKLNGAEARMMNRWSEHYLIASRNEDKPFFLKYTEVFYKLVSVFSAAAIFLFGTNMPASDYIAFAAAYGAYSAALMSIPQIIKTVSSFRSSYTLIRPMLDAECEEYGGQKKKLTTLHGEITITDLSFRYDKKAPYVINGLSAHIRPGESIGIIGASGCGKSTLLRLLLGFESPDEGSIYIDGFDLRELDLRSYRQKVGTVLQNTGLISGDIYSNITVTKPGAALEEVTSVIEMAGLSKDIAALPMGLHTPVGHENCTLSGGQRQRILIARALIHKPSILIFDEATSALDNITQAKITENMNNLDCTKIIVAHRLSTIEQCDRILVLDKGGIAEEGRFDELMNAGGILTQLTKKQITN